MADTIIQGQSTLSLQETFLTTRVEGGSATAPLSSILLQFMQEYLYHRYKHVFCRDLRAALCGS